MRSKRNQITDAREEVDMAAENNMVARINTSELVPEKVEEARKLWTDRIIPEMKKQPGFKRVYVLTNAQTRKVTTISIWESAAHSDAWGSSKTLRELASHLKPTVRHIPSPDIYDVSLEG
jgi:heme-degrading monooxygenase HmoA